MKAPRPLLAGAAVTMLLSCFAPGCFTPKYNQELDSSGAQGAAGAQGQAAMEPVQDEDTLFLVALSGGGTRAAAMSWDVLERLRSIEYEYTGPDGDPVTTNLAHEIDYISGISGGSFAAAAWCLYGRDPKEFAAFRARFIERDIEGALLRNILWPPWRALMLMSPRYDRIHVAADLYDREVFHDPVSKRGSTFGDLPPHPVLWINATNLALGNRFTFKGPDRNRHELDEMENDFILIGSDISCYPIGYACAASSAFPVLLSPLTLENHAEPGRDLAEGEAGITYGNKQADARGELLDVNADLYVRMRDFYNDVGTRYVHLADGGLVDNQGLQAILDEFSDNGVIYTKLDDFERPLKRLVILNVNAGAESDDASSSKATAPGIASVLGYTTVLSMDLLSAKRWVDLQEEVDEQTKATVELRDTTESRKRLEPGYAIEINFRNLAGEDRAQAWALPTTFALDAEQLKVIDDAVGKLMQPGQNAVLDRLVSSLEAKRPE